MAYLTGPDRPMRNVLMDLDMSMFCPIDEYHLYKAGCAKCFPQNICSVASLVLEKKIFYFG